MSEIKLNGKYYDSDDSSEEKKWYNPVLNGNFAGIIQNVKDKTKNVGKWNHDKKQYEPPYREVDGTMIVYCIFKDNKPVYPWEHFTNNISAQANFGKRLRILLPDLFYGDAKPSEVTLHRALENLIGKSVNLQISTKTKGEENYYTISGVMLSREVLNHEKPLETPHEAINFGDAENLDFEEDDLPF